MKQKSYTELAGDLLHNIYNKNGPPDSLDSKSAIVPGFPGVFIRILDESIIL